MAKIDKYKIDNLKVVENKTQSGYSYNVSGVMTASLKSDSFDTIKDGTVYQMNFDLQNDFSERPECISDMIKSDKVQNDIDKGVSSMPGPDKLNFIYDLTDTNLLNKFIVDFSDDKLDLKEKRIVKGIEYNYRLQSVSRVLVLYKGQTKDDYYETVDLKRPVTDRIIREYLPSSNLVSYYNSFEKWLGEDYKSTLDMAKEIWGFDFETLKGADVA